MPVDRRDGYRLWVGGPVPKGAVAITLGNTVIVRAGFEGSAQLLRHELVHVRQWRRHGVLGFGLRYVGNYVKWRLRRKGHRGAYLRIPFEIEAEWTARQTPSEATLVLEQRDPVSR